MMTLVPITSAGIRSGVNWMRLNFRFSACGQRADQGGLAQAGHAFEQRVAADEQAGEHAVDDLLVADDRLGDLRLHGAVVAAEVLAELLDLRVDAGEWGCGHLGSFRNEPDHHGDTEARSCSSLHAAFQRTRRMIRVSDDGRVEINQ